MTNSTPLSPAAQAVYDAFWKDLDFREDFTARNIAAALRAAADQVVPLRDAPKIAFNAKRPTVEWHVWNAKQQARLAFLAIAAELEGAGD